MHEMSIVQELLSIIEQEMGRHGVSSVVTVTVKHGKLTNVVPEALQFAWQSLTPGTMVEGAELKTEEIPLLLRCGGCKTEFSPEDLSAAFAPCPECEEQIGHEILQGRELYIENMEAEEE